MPDDTPTLRQLIEAWQSHHDALHAVHDATHLREHQMADLAIRKAEDGMTLRLAGMNEFRASMADASSKYATKEQMDAKMENITQRLATIERGSANMAGRLWALGLLFSFLIVAIPIAIRFLT